MQIKNMFEKDIERDIKGVIKVDQKDEDLIYQELDEYVVTNELLKHFNEFFANYSKSLSKPTDDIGVWISGFFGSGKSHFLKILSYILDSNLTVKGRKPIEFFKEDRKIDDSILIGNMESATNVDTDVILFNIDSKSAQSQDKNILDVFVKVFNEMRGYCSTMPFLAEFEKMLDKEGKFETFKQEFESSTGKSWEERRNAFYIIRDKVIDVVFNMGFMSKNSVHTWLVNSEKNFNITIEDFAIEVSEYCKSTGRRVIFLVDEVGQFIADDSQLMLNLQTIVEELGIKCHGNAWVFVTSQESIDELTKDIKGIDFSKIQGRFKTKLSLSSSDVDEIIRRRILAKNTEAQQFLESEYDSFDSTLKNIISFDGTVEMKTYTGATDFANVYPFVPYQFNRVQDVLTSIREHSASGKHMADGERSMLALFQESAIAMKEDNDGALVPFNIFYKAVDKFIDHTHRIVINKAKDNDYLNDFDVEVLKVLFMIKYVKEIKATSKNLTTLMISNVNEDRLELNKKINNSLKHLFKQTLIQKNGDVYSFLTNEEQDVNNEIKKELVDHGEILDYASSRIFSEIYATKKYKVSNRYNFEFNKSIDEKEKSSNKFDIGIRIITPSYDTNTLDSQTQLDTSGNNSYYVLKGLSDSNSEVIVQLPDDVTVFDEIKEVLQISKYLTKKSGDLKSELRARKREEYNDKNDRIKSLLEEAIKHATIFVKGDKADIPEKDPSNRLDEAMEKLVDKVYNKLSYMDIEPNVEDIKEVLKEESQSTFLNQDTDCLNALNDLEDYVSRQFSIHLNPSLKAVINKFSSAPYGFTKLDIQWLVAKLFTEKRISLTINSKELSLKFDDVEKITTYLTSTEYFEKLLISKRETTNINYLKSVKNILKEVYNQTNLSDDDEKLMGIFKKKIIEKLKEVNEYLIEFKIFDEYPGKKSLDDASELFKEIDSKKRLIDFYKYIYDNEDDILETFEDLEPVISFFTGSQKRFYKEAYDIYEIYKSNKGLIQDRGLDDVSSAIKLILDMPNPYSNIHKLPELCKEFNNTFEVILENERQIVGNDIGKDLDIVLGRLTDNELKEHFTKDFESKFNSLKEKLNNEKNIFIIRGITDESDKLRENCLEKINKFNEFRGNTSYSIKETTIYIKNIFNESKVIIKSEEDLDKFFEKIKNRAKSDLENVDVINLKF